MAKSLKAFSHSFATTDAERRWMPGFIKAQKARARAAVGEALLGFLESTEEPVTVQVIWTTERHPSFLSEGGQVHVLTASVWTEE